MRNKKAQFGELWMIGLIAFFIFLFGSLFIAPIKDLAGSTHTDLGCATPASLSDGSKLLCLGTDVVVPYFILIILSIAGSMIINRFASGETYGGKEAK